MNPNFEKYIQQSLKNQEDFVDAEAIWEEVEPHVRPQKKRRRIFWWFFFGASIAVMTMALWNHSEEDSTLLVQEDSLAGIQHLLEEKEPTLMERKKVRKLKDKSSENISNGITTKEALTGNIQEKKINQIDKRKKKRAQNTFAKVTPKNNTTVLRKDKTLEVTDLSLPEKPIERASFIERLQDGSYKPLSDEPQSSMVIAPFDEEEEGDVNELLSEKLFALDLSSTIAELSYEKQENLIPESVKLIEPAHKQPKWKFAIGLYAGIGKTTPDWTLDEERGNSEYFASRKATEKQLESSSIGLSFSAQMKNNISFRSGLEYHLTARRFNYEENQITHDTIPDAILKLYVNESTGDTIVDRGEFINTHTESYEKETYNYFHRLDIPLFVGCHFKKGRFLLGIEAGTFVNVLLRKKGELIELSEDTENRSFYDLKEDEAQWYKTKLGLTPAVQMNFGYEFAPGIEAYASPYYRFRTTFSSSTNLVKEAYSDVGIQLGIKYWLR